MDSLPEDAGAGPLALAMLARFRREFHACLTARRDDVFELADAVLCAGGPVRNLAALSLAPEHRRGHGALYDGVNSGRIEITRLRRCLAGLPLPRAADGRLMLAADVSNWLRPGAATSPGRLFCHVYGRGKGQAQMIPGWPYSVVAALEPGRTSWTAVLDAIRLGPGDDAAEVTATPGPGGDHPADRRRALARGGSAHPGDLRCGYDPMRLAYQLADLPAGVQGRLRSDRVLHFPIPPRRCGANGRPPRHGRELALADPATWPDPAVTITTQTTRYGTAVAQAWDRLHPRLTHRSASLDHDGPLPVIEGILIRLQVDHLPGDRDPKPVWLWCPVTGAAPAEVDGYDSTAACSSRPRGDACSQGDVLGGDLRVAAADQELAVQLLLGPDAGSVGAQHAGRGDFEELLRPVLGRDHPGQPGPILYTERVAAADHVLQLREHLLPDGGVAGGGLGVEADDHPVGVVAEPHLLDVHVLGDLPVTALPQQGGLDVRGCGAELLARM
jgi:hypothetical protein